MAGCPMATTLIRVFGIEACDILVLPPSVSLDVYIDGANLDGVGPLESLVSNLINAAGQLEQAISCPIKAHTALD
eukprot:3073251-Pyramimonas_sp.AAC.3